MRILPGISAAIGSTEYGSPPGSEPDSLTQHRRWIGGACRPALAAKRLQQSAAGPPLDLATIFPTPRCGSFQSRAMGYVETTLRDGLTLRQLPSGWRSARASGKLPARPEQVADRLKTGSARALPMVSM